MFPQLHSELETAAKIRCDDHLAAEGLRRGRVGSSSTIAVRRQKCTITSFLYPGALGPAPLACRGRSMPKTVGRSIVVASWEKDIDRRAPGRRTESHTSVSLELDHRLAGLARRDPRSRCWGSKWWVSVVDTEELWRDDLQIRLPRSRTGFETRPGRIHLEPAFPFGTPPMIVWGPRAAFSGQARWRCSTFFRSPPAQRSEQEHRDSP